jgi:hypothetical protein
VLAQQRAEQRARAAQARAAEQQARQPDMSLADLLAAMPDDVRQDALAQLSDTDLAQLPPQVGVCAWTDDIAVMRRVVLCVGFHCGI